MAPRALPTPQLATPRRGVDVASRPSRAASRADLRNRAGRWWAALALAPLAALAVAGCGGDSQPVPSRSTVTITVPPSGPAEDESVAAAPSPSAATTQATAEATATPGELPRIDRGYDAAFVVESREQDGFLVLRIDRLTVAGIDDDTLAQQGAPLAVDRGDRFVNQAVRYYEVGVSSTARWVLNTCEDSGGGPALSSQPVSAEVFLGTPGLAGTPVLVQYGDGLVARIETSPRC